MRKKFFTISICVMFIFSMLVSFSVSASDPSQEAAGLSDETLLTKSSKFYSAVAPQSVKNCLRSFRMRVLPPAI